MIFELLYTSVPKGLKPGAKGYCTVLTTEGIPSALLERLEGYCGYRHLFSPGSPDNPEAFGHRILNLAGNTWHILSRVADAGSDYSGRSNLIGHFMAISEDELKGISAGPTSLMMSDGFFRTVLEGEPRRVSESETRKRLGNLTDKTQQALTWAKVTGHAGWAGRLVQVTEETSDSIALVYPLRTKTLKLLDEAACILPKHKQWDITFNTFFTKSGEECRWRCYCADVTEAGPFKGGEFDLVEVKRIGEPPVDSPYAEAATNGKNKVGASPAAKPASGAKARTPIKPNSEKSLEAGQSFADKRKAKREDDDFHAIINKDTKQPSVKPTQHSLEVLPRQAGPLPPPVNRAPRSIDLLNDVMNEGKNPRNRKSQRPDSVIIVLSVIVSVLVIIVILLGKDKILSKPNPAGVGITKDDSKKSDPIVDKPIDELLTVKPPEKKGDSTAAEKKAADEKLAAEKKVADEKLAAEKKAADTKPITLVDAKNPSGVSGMSPNGLGTKQAAQNGNSLTEIVAIEEMEGNLIVPLDKHLKDKSKEDFLRIIEKGITVTFPDKIKFEGKPIIKCLDLTKAKRKSIEADRFEGNKLYIKFSPDLKPEDIDWFTLAFTKIKQNYEKDSSRNINVQFFEPLSLKQDIEYLGKFELTGNSVKTVKSIHFIANDAIKEKMIRSWIDSKNDTRISVGRPIYQSSTVDFCFIHNDTELNRTIDDMKNNYKNLKSALLIEPQGFEIVRKNISKTETSEKYYLLSFTNFRCFLPVTFNERSAFQQFWIKYEQNTKLDPKTREILASKYLIEFEQPLGKEYTRGHYYFASTSKDHPKFHDWEPKSIPVMVGFLKKHSDELIGGQNGSGKFYPEFLKYIGVDSDPMALKMRQLTDHMQLLQEYLKGKNPDFSVAFRIEWTSILDDNETKTADAENKEYFKDAKIVGYTYKQPK